MSTHSLSPDRDRVPPVIAYSGVTIVGGTALAVLAWYQHLLGVRAMMPELLSWSFSIGLDWGSGVAGIFWFFSADRTLRRWASSLSILLIGASTAMTCVSWGLIAGWIWSPLGAVHTLVFFGMAKLLTLWQAVRAREKAEDAAREAAAEARMARRAAQPRPAPEPVPVPAPVPAPAPIEAAQVPEPVAARLVDEPVQVAGAQVREIAEGRSTAAQVRAWFRAEYDAGRTPTGADADAAFGLEGSARCGARELRTVLAEREAAERERQTAAS